ncbi:hypothetical protein FSP39_000218 [Pinctada imbricata]|uniref:Tesmin/TSO1-like CXC domain-containing protein n=1 Tax=Pinctada imbricata TaxID=66713 RepID=A0AA88YGD0_PINIB|nr:hypothetical protein FSP39_000218 [Pinctada imbricata]
MAKFIDATDVDKIVKAGEEIMSEMYNGIPHEGLDLLRYRKFTSKVITGNIYVHVHTLPPTSDSTRYHSLRTYFQCNIWSGQDNNLCPSDFGWIEKKDMLLPLKGTLPPAPDKLLKIIRCTCKTNCDTRRCSCRKYGLCCTIGCAECKGSSCSNTTPIVSTDDSE